MFRSRHDWLLTVVCAVAVGCGGDGKNENPSDAEKKNAADAGTKDGGTNESSSDQGFDSAFIPNDTVAILAVHVAEILESELLADAPIEDDVRTLEKNLGLSPGNIRQIVVPIGPQLMDRNKGGVAVIVRTREPYKRQGIGGRQFAGERRGEGEFQGEKYLRSMYRSWNSDGKDGPLKPTGNVIYFADDKTLIIGSEEPLKRSLAAGDSDSELIKRFKNAESHDVVFLADATSARGLLKTASMAVKEPEQSELATWVAEHVTTVSAWLDASPVVKLHVALDTDDEEAGARLQEESKEGLAALNGLIKLAGPLALKSPDSPLTDELADKLLKLGHDAVAAIKTKGNGNSFEVSFEEPSDTRTVLAEVMPVLKKLQAENTARARTLDIRFEMSTLAHALESYRFDYREYPPSDPAQAAAHVAKAFPKVPRDAIAGEVAAFDVPQRALTFWLAGISPDPTKPLTGTDRRPYVRFDPQRVGKDGSYRPRAEGVTTPFAYESDGKSIKITHPGLDGKSGTSDDLVYPEIRTPTEGDLKVPEKSSDSRN